MPSREQVIGPLLTPDFKNFVIKILKMAKLKQRGIDLLTTRENLLMIRQAFVHITYDLDYNYEMFETIGDKFLKAQVGRYVHRRFPMIVSSKWLTRLNHLFEQKSALSKFAEKMGFWKYIIYGDVMEQILEKCKIKGDDTAYKTLLEDSFEAFVGSIVLIFDSYTVVGVGDAFAYYMYRSIADNLDIRADYRIFDAVSRLKELVYDRYDMIQKGWGICNQTTEKDPITGNITVTIYDPRSFFPLDNSKCKEKSYKPKLKEPKFRIILGKATSGTPDPETGKLMSAKETNQAASEMAFKKLTDPNGPYRLIYIPPDPYEGNVNIRKYDPNKCSVN